MKVPSPQREEQRYLSADEVALLADAIHPRFRTLVLTGAYAALRWGELAGLRVPQLRLLARKLDIAETLIEVEGNLVSGPPKTGLRTVSIPGALADEVGAHIARYPGRDGYVFTAPDGGPLRHNNFTKRFWKKAVQAAELEPLRIHDLRHTAVALAVAAGAHPKEIQELCGHASITTTLNIYGHLFESLQERLAERLDVAYRQARRSTKESLSSRSSAL
ncbi:MAG: tyrosine-type recombinase/integrase [Actinomycetota bacterium]